MIDICLKYTIVVAVILEYIFTAYFCHLEYTIAFFFFAICESFLSVTLEMEFLYQIYAHI